MGYENNAATTIFITDEHITNTLFLAIKKHIAHQGGIKFKPELRVRNQDYGGMKVDHFVVEKR